MLIVADDLSGAADCGIACTTAGLHTVVLLHRSADRTGADVVAIDADTRWRSPNDAAAVTAEIVQNLWDEQQPVLFKKLDSTLRGNVGQELAAVVRTFRQRSRRTSQRHPTVLLAPAFPRNGRTTRDGRQFVNGVPLEETELWQRERMPGRAYIPQLLQTAELRSETITLDVVRSGHRSLSFAIAERRKDADVLVCDAETDADLSAIAKSSVAEPDLIWAGSAGLARHIPQAMGINSNKPPILQTFSPGPILFAIGSLSRVSRSQVENLVASPNVRRVIIPADILFRGSGAPEWSAVKHDLQSTLENGINLVVTPTADGEIDLNGGRLLSGALAEVIAPCARHIGGLVAAGGETARAILQALDVQRLELISELEPGIAVSAAVCWSRPLPVITKAGDFGNGQTLLHCREFLQQLQCQTTSAFPE